MDPSPPPTIETSSTTGSSTTDAHERTPARALIVVVAVVLLLCVGVVGLVGGFAQDAAALVLDSALAVSYGLLGGWVARRGVWVIGYRMTLVGLAAAISWAAQAWSAFTLSAWLAEWSWLLPLVMVPAVLVRFPDGRVPAGWRRFEPVLFVACAAPVAILAGAAVGSPRHLLTGTGERPGWTELLITLSVGAAGFWLLGCMATVALLIQRARHALGNSRAQVSCLAIGLLALLISVAVLISGAPEWVEVLTALSLPAAITLAVLRYSLYDLDLVVNRLLVWIGLSLSVALVFVLLVTLLSPIVPGATMAPTGLLALVVVTLLLEPLRRLLQRAVDRLLFGRRSAPAEAFTLVSRDLGRAAGEGSGTVLCRSVASTLQLPWVGIRGDDGSMMASWGRDIGESTTFPLRLADRHVGDLLVAPRRRKQRWTRAERSILEGMAAQVAVAVEAMQLADRLRGARERIVVSREQERQRLRADLHDGLGPALVGLRLQASACAKMATQPALAHALARVVDDASTCVGEVARVVDGLRPAVLDDGLATALRVEAKRLVTHDTEVEVVAPDILPAMSEAAELAVFRIASEAMSNAVRHSGGSRIELHLDDIGGAILKVSISDNGSGMGPPRDGGMGLESMRRRAEEAGGTLSINQQVPCGTVVAAKIPFGVNGHAKRLTEEG